MEVIAMVANDTATTARRLVEALSHPSSSVRLRAAMAAGTSPDPVHVAPLIARCEVEPDFFVRDMLTWALVRHERADTVDSLLAELASPAAQARSQALHTLSKIGDARAWPTLTPSLLEDEDDEVARAAWRAAVALAPADAWPDLARTLATQLGRGDRDVQRSLSRALAALGEASVQVVADAHRHPDPDVRAHAHATERLMADPEADFGAAVEAARREVALAGVPAGPDGGDTC